MALNSPTEPPIFERRATDGTAATPTEGRLAVVLSGFGLVLPLTGIVSPQAVVPLLLGAALLTALTIWQGERRLPWPDTGLSLALGVLILWCAVASLWSPDPLGSLVLTLRISILFAAALALHAQARRLGAAARAQVGGFLLAGVVIGLGVLVAELAFDFRLARAVLGNPENLGRAAVFFNREAVALAMLCWPATAALWRMRVGRLALALPVATLGILSFLYSLSAIVGVLAGMAVVLIALVRRRLARAVLVAATLGALLASPAAGHYLYDLGWQGARWLPSSAAHRVEIWRFTVDRIAERPLLGYGFDSARAMQRWPVVLEDTGRSPLSLHPHNASLQILLELGVVGAVIALGIALYMIHRLDALPARERALGQAAYLAILAMSATAYGLWQNQSLALIASVSIMVALTGDSVPPRGGEGGETEMTPRAKTGGP